MKGARVEHTGPSHEMFELASTHSPYVAVFGSIYLLGEWFDWAGIGADELVTWHERG